MVCEMGSKWPCRTSHEFVLASPAVSCMSCSSYLDSFRDGKYSCYFVDVASGTCLKQLETFVCSSRLAFSLYTKSASMWCIHIVELTQPLLGRNRVRIICIRKKYLNPFKRVQKMSFGTFKNCQQQNVFTNHIFNMNE